MKRTILTGYWFCCLSILIGGFLASCSSEKEEQRAEVSDESPIQKQQQEKARQEAIANLARKHNAVTDWGKRFEGVQFPYTAQIQETLVRQGGRPILFIVNGVQDVEIQDGQYFLYLRSKIDFRAELILALRCDEKLAERIMSMPRLAYFWDDYAVVALIQDVQRLKLHVGPIENKDNQSEVEVEYMPDYFIARGDCLELLDIP